MLRDRFEKEADGLWRQLQQLAAHTPRLERLYGRDADPRVARLVQSAAFAFATAQGRLDDDGQSLVRPLVARALPEALRPRPASTVIELRSESGQSTPALGTSFAAQVAGHRVPFRVAWPAAMTPFVLTDVGIDRVDARTQSLHLAFVGRSGIAAGAALPAVVRFFVHLEPRSVAIDLVHALRSGGPGRVRWLGKGGAMLGERRLAREAVRWVRVDTEELPLVAARADRFRSGTMLRDLFSFPESYCFFDLDLGGPTDKAAERVEVTLPLGHVVHGAADLSTEQLRLFCAPATNQFVAPIDPVRRRDASEAALAVAGKLHAEILEVRALSTVSIRDASRRTPLRSWETPDVPHAFDPDDTYFALEQRASPADGRTEMRAIFGRLGEFPAPVGGVVEGEVLACDAALTAYVGLGQVGSVREGAISVTRVTPSRRAVLGENHAWRASAYARMPAARLANAGRLEEFVGLHDRYGLADDSVRIHRPRFVSVEHAREHRLEAGVLGWGDAFTVELDATPCSEGELWLLGSLLERALAERSEALRFSRVVLRRNGATLAEYAPRRGERLPFPLG
jgi:type VI protein secretion system component VasA